MAVETTNYQCPACGGPLHYDGAAGGLKCDYCDSTFEAAQIERLYADAAAKAEAAVENASDFDTVVNDDGMRVYTCPSCAAELVADDTTAVTQCPYCGNPTVVPGVMKGEFEPDLVIPFRLDKKAAASALKRHYEGKKLLPDAFARGNRVEEVQGVYVPFWLFDSRAAGDGRYVAENHRTYRQGDYEVTEVDHYDVWREGTLDFERVPVDSSARMPDAHMDAIEPFDYGELVPYSVAYLPGYLANRYDQTAEECRPRAEGRMESSFESELDSTVTGYSSVARIAGSTQVRCSQPAYALLPVWMLATRWNGESFLFAMNGQTGKLIGNLPVDKGKAVRWFLGVFAALAVLLAAAFYLTGTFEEYGLAAQIGAGAVMGLIISLINLSVLYGQMRTAQVKTQADDYLAGSGLTLTGRRDTFINTTRVTRKIEKNQG